MNDIIGLTDDIPLPVTPFKYHCRKLLKYTSLLLFGREVLIGREVLTILGLQTSVIRLFTKWSHDYWFFNLNCTLFVVTVSCKTLVFSPFSLNKIELSM